MEDSKHKIKHPAQEPDATTPNKSAEVAELTDNWKRSLAEAENARKRADAARLEGRELGVTPAVEALAPVYDQATEDELIRSRLKNEFYSNAAATSETL